MLVVLFAAAAVAAALHRGHLCSSQPRHTQCRLAAWGLTPWASANAIFRAPLAFCQMSGPNGGDSGSMNDAVGLTGVLAGAALKPEEPRLLRHRKTLQHQGGSSGVSCFPFIFRTERSGNGPTRRLESPAVCRAGGSRSVRDNRWLCGASKKELSLSFIYFLCAFFTFLLNCVLCTPDIRKT